MGKNWKSRPNQTKIKSIVSLIWFSIFFLHFNIDQFCQFLNILNWGRTSKILTNISLCFSLTFGNVGQHFVTLYQLRISFSFDANQDLEWQKIGVDHLCHLVEDLMVIVFAFDQDDLHWWLVVKLKSTGHFW